MYSSFKDNIWGVDLADMQLISKYNKGIRYLLCTIDFFSKYTFVIPLKDKKGTTIVNAFRSILDKSKRKTNKIWIDQGSEFYNNKFKKWLKIMILPCILHIMKENQLLLKYLLEP